MAAELSAKDTAGLRGAHAAYRDARDRVWVERIGAGLRYRQEMRAIDDRVRALRTERDEVVRAAVAGGASYRQVARALGLSHSRIQQIVNAEPG